MGSLRVVAAPRHLPAPVRSTPSTGGLLQHPGLPTLATSSSTCVSRAAPWRTQQTQAAHVRVGQRRREVAPVAGSGWVGAGSGGMVRLQGGGGIRQARAEPHEVVAVLTHVLDASLSWKTRGHAGNTTPQAVLHPRQFCTQAALQPRQYCPQPVLLPPPRLTKTGGLVPNPTRKLRPAAPRA